MAAIKLKVTIPESREVKIELPDTFPIGEAEITVEAARTEEEIPWEDRPWTQEELDEALHFTPSTMGEILESGLVGSGADLEIEDSATYVEHLRHSEEAQRRKRWTDS